MYQLQNQYQDSSWENIDGEQYERPLQATMRARHLSKDAIAYSMVRVVDTSDNSIIAEYSAGGPR